MIITLLLAFGLVLWWLAVRRRRARILAGLTATKPVFSVEPPHRRMSPLKSEAL